MSAHFLIVDDDSDHLELIVMALSECCEPELVATARSGTEALDYLRRHAPDRLPKAVMLDMRLGAMRGVDVLRTIRADPELRHLPVVIHSSSRDERDVAASYEAGASSYVVKCSSFSEMRRVMAGFHSVWEMSELPHALAGP